MADRPNHVPGYPMPQANFMNLPQQQQPPSMPYQHPQGTMNPAQQIPGVTNPEHQRMWQQIQDRHRAMGAADGMGQQHMNPQQMADFLRSQAALSQVQNNQQSPQLQQVQQFANLGGVTQMNNGLPGQNPMVAMQRQQQGMQGGNIPGMSNPQLTPQVVQFLSQQRNGVSNPAMLQMNRQLGLLNRAQKQQPQNGPANFNMPGPSFSGQQSLGQMPQQGMFQPKPEDARFLGAQGQQQFAGAPSGPIHGHGMPNDVLQQAFRNNDGRPLTLDEIRRKVQVLKLSIETEKDALAKASQNAGPEAAMALREKHQEIDRKEILFIRMAEEFKNQRLAQMQPNNAANLNNGQGGGGLFPNVSQQQQSGHIEPNQNWMPQMNNANVQHQINGNGLPGNQQIVNDNTQAQALHQTLGSPFHPNLVQSQQQTPVPRSAPTPQQQQQMLALFQQNNTHSSPPSSGRAPLVGQGNLGQQSQMLEGQENPVRPNGLNFPPLARERFLHMLQEWWKRNNIKPDPRMATIGNRTIDIYQLHTEVLQYGGVVNVRRHDLWNVIAAKLGWTPAAISEVGRTKEQIAEQFKNVYEQLLESFEVSFMQVAMKQSLTAPPPPQQSAENHGQIPASAGPSQPPGQQMSTQQAVQMIRLANMTADQLRAAGYPDNLIQNIEQNRPALAVTWRRMQLQRLQQQQQQSQSQMQQPGPVLNGQLPFSNQMQAQPNANAMHAQTSMPGANALGLPGGSAGSNQSNDLPVQQRPQLNPQQLQLQNMLQNLRKPTMESGKQALVLIEQMKAEISKERTFRPEHVKQLPETEKGAFAESFETICNVLREMCRFLHLYLSSTSDINTVRGILSMLDMCDKQRQLLQSANPVYVLDVATLQKLLKQCGDIKTRVYLVLQQVRIMSAHQSQVRQPLSQQGDGNLPPPSGPGGPQTGPPQQNIVQSPASAPPRPPATQPQQPPHPSQQNLRQPPGKTPQMAPARPPSVAHAKGKAQPATSPNAVENAPSPSVSTPLPSGPTPQPSQTPKSPKTTKNQTKPRARQRRQSKVQPPTNANASSTPVAPATATSGQAAATTSTPAAEPAPSPAQAQSAPSPKPNLKRPRDEGSSDQTELATGGDAANEGTPSKRLKNEWDNVPDTEPSRTQIEAEKIKTPEDASKFYNDMSQILEMSSNADLPPDLHETLAQLVKTVGNGIDIPDTGRNANILTAGPSSPKADSGDDFFSFLDFTAFQQDDDKAETPGLDPTSSTNPSPESGAGSEADHPPTSAISGLSGDRTKIVDTSDSEPKADFFDIVSDPLRLGIWGEIDGGESSYFNSSDMWKWDGVTSSGENSWAIST